MVPLEHAIARDFIPLRGALVAELGAAPAILWQLIWFRTGPDSPASYEQNGHRWWRANREELSKHSGLTVDQVKRIVSKLEADGALESARHQAGGVTDHTKSYRCLTDEIARPIGANPPNLDWGKSAQSSYKNHEEEKTPSSLVQERDDVRALCTQLADLIEENGSPRPTVGAGWRDAARLLLDRDHRPLDEAMQVLEWSQRDDFWRSNILSMPTFRKQYDKLRLRMGRNPGQSRGQQRQEEAMALIERAARRDQEYEAAGHRGTPQLDAGPRWTAPDGHLGRGMD
ncbi:hypothetical protein GCM10009706_14090 [Curtobacterium citreum]|uniref:Replication protein n=1 Tax=Curtobacterium citreum TaxID=2036 RepID=A0ABT2HDV2_9MICO|nr:hypothetical protein [Curtobacterium citreum]MCS6521363.1 hypothetical protein [Curtobacterium citreum]TQJ28222.1 hypothetical protein FB462_2102 [Curtobacterium citreum]GGL76835.1 hypothetical protein GCM10009706_14090 [Curtobacterium citreum]